jgi:hypothetical protein
LLDEKVGDGKKAGRKGAAGLHKKLDLDDYEFDRKQHER